MTDIADFYSKLYSSSKIPNDKVDAYLNNIQISKVLSESEKLLCEEQVSEKDLSEAMAKIKNNRSPGCDGLTTEFYKTFMPDFQDIFINMLHETFEYGQLSESLTISILT